MRRSPTWKAENALRESEERFRTLIQNIHDYAIFRLDANLIVTQGPEGAQRVAAEYTRSTARAALLLALGRR